MNDVGGRGGGRQRGPGRGGPFRFRVGGEGRCGVAMASNAASLNAVRETMDGGWPEWRGDSVRREAAPARPLGPAEQVLAQRSCPRPSPRAARP